MPVITFTTIGAVLKSIWKSATPAQKAAAAQAARKGAEAARDEPGMDDWYFGKNLGWASYQDMRAAKQKRLWREESGYYDEPLRVLSVNGTPVVRGQKVSDVIAGPGDPGSRRPVASSISGNAAQRAPNVDARIAGPGDPGSRRAVHGGAVTGSNSSNSATGLAALENWQWIALLGAAGAGAYFFLKPGK
jgi:hypothetical protein